MTKKTSPDPFTPESALAFPHESIPAPELEPFPVAAPPSSPYPETVPIFPAPEPVAPPAHALSPAEIEAVLAKAVEDKRKELGLDEETVKARQAEAEARAIRQKDLAALQVLEDAKREREARLQEPDRWIGLDQAGSGTYSYVKVSAGRQHRLTVAGVTYEHVATDGEGIWLYRYMA